MYQEVSWFFTHSLMKEHFIKGIIHNLSLVVTSSVLYCQGNSFIRLVDFVAIIVTNMLVRGDNFYQW